MKTIIKLPFLLLAILLWGNARSQCTDSIIVRPISFGAFSFTDNPSSFDSSATPWIAWSFGDGTVDTSSGFYQPYVSHQFTTNDTVTICATNINTGCVACVTIDPNLCQGNIGFISSLTGFGTYNFAADANGMAGTLQAVWTFGDGDSSFTLNPSHHYAASGNYNVCLTLISSAGVCTASTCQNLQVTLCSFQTAFFDSINASSATGPFIVSNPVSGYQYLWNYGDGTTGTGDTLLHQYAANGYYNVCLTTYDPATACRDTQCDQLYFDHCNIHAEIDASGNGLTVLYQCNFIYTNPPITLYSWTFPGGTPATGSQQNEQVTYTSYGGISASLIVNVNGTCNDTFSYSGTVSPPTYNIQGSIWDGGSSQGCGTVYLIKKDSTQRLVLVDSVITMDTIGYCYGGYIFANLPADTFYVKAALDSADANYSNYLPTYYGDQLHWADATAIIVADGDQGGDIHMIAGSNQGGPGFIAGLVSQGAGLAAQGGTAQVLRGTNAVGDPLANIQINLLTAANEPVTYTYTDASGHFYFKNIAVGDYQVYAEAINRVPTAVPVEITAENPTDTSLHISVSSNSATGINSIGNVTVSGIYPNPASTKFTLQLSSTQNIAASLKLMDVLGRQVEQQQLKLVNGNNTTEMNIEQLPAGVYELTIQTSNGQLTLPLVKAK